MFPATALAHRFFRQESDTILESLAERDVPSPEAFVTEMCEKRGPQVLVGYLVDGLDSGDLGIIALDEAFCEILEWIRQSITSSAFGSEFDDALHIDEPMFPYRVHADGLLVVLEREFPHERTFADAVQYPLIADPP